VFCFKKSHRLLKKTDFDFVFQNPKKITNPDFVVLYRENNCGNARLGLAISKKAIAKAHDRNRIKRVIRESFRKADLPAVDLVFLSKKNISTANTSKIASNLGKLWDRLAKQ